MRIKLSNNQYDYLYCNLLSKREDLKTTVQQVEKDNKFISLEVDSNTADKIRDCANEELQKKGFDENYELTQSGEILEELIDLFYVG
jgi:RNA polymerase-binding transcription factor DksA